MRSSFLQRYVKNSLAQSPVAIPSKWGLLSYNGVTEVMPCDKGMSQSLLNEVFFPTHSRLRKRRSKSMESQSLLNEVFFPTKQFKEVRKCWSGSQSLLNEVFFPTVYVSIRSWRRQGSQSLLNEVFFPTPTFKWEITFYIVGRNPF